MYKLEFSQYFKKSYKKYVRNNKILKLKVDKTLKILASNPFHSSLRSHKVTSKSVGEAWSIWVTGDIRIIWRYDNERALVIILHAIGSHSGSKSVY